ncbi:hypothetical protein BHE74_00006361 [Ensete ventricosum]|nr:hypothetical protein BHE74_00006361 [Ensete ventricosum]
MLRGVPIQRCTGRRNEPGLAAQTQHRPMNRVTFCESREEERSRKHGRDGPGEKRVAQSPVTCPTGRMEEMSSSNSWSGVTGCILKVREGPRE